MRKLLYLSILLASFFTVLASFPAYAVAPPPVFRYVGSAAACISGGSVNDYTIDALSGRQWVLTDTRICKSDDHGVTWSPFTAGGPYTCFPTTGGIHLKKFQTLPDKTIVAVTGTPNCSTGDAAWYLNNVTNPPGTTFTKSVSILPSSSINPWGYGATLGNGSYVMPMTNSSSPTGVGIFLSTNNGRTWSKPTTYPASGITGETFGALKVPNSNITYIGYGETTGLCATGKPPLMYTTDADGTHWQFIPKASGQPCGDTWTPIVVPPGHGSYSGKGLFITGPGLSSDNKAWVFGPLTSPTALTFTNVTGNLFSSRGGTDHSAEGYNNLTVGIDWNYRIFATNMNWTLTNHPGLAPVWTDSLPTWGQLDQVSGNALPSFYTSPCTVGSPRPNFCLTMAIAFDKNPGSSTYGHACIIMRSGALYCTELPQSHKASSFSWRAGALTVGIGKTTGPEQIDVRYLDQDTSDPACPAIQGNPPLYPARSAGVFSSSNPGVATVNATTGVVTGVAAGMAYPLFTCGGVTSPAGPAITVR